VLIVKFILLLLQNTLDGCLALFDFIISSICMSMIICHIIERHITVVELIKRRKLKQFGCICRMKDARLVMTVLLGMVEGNGPCGWSVDLVDWCGYSVPEAVKWQQITSLNGLYGP